MSVPGRVFSGNVDWIFFQPFDQIPVIREVKFYPGHGKADNITVMSRLKTVPSDTRQPFDYGEIDLTSFTTIGLEQLQTIGLLNRHNAKCIFHSAQLSDFLESLLQHYRFKRDMCPEQICLEDSEGTFHPISSMNTLYIFLCLLSNPG